eukprot:TRINITY_DN301_c0_g1_i1.p1 TRINITY_DN301_c0_g1~~TRINITY_DN301_c0_g1_i1.p1  ORF type:complete len:682 (-),score=183.79 TRINITY_DN301_c0_g1_i1:783-2828(-)
MANQTQRRVSMPYNIKHTHFEDLSAVVDYFEVENERREQITQGLPPRTPGSVRGVSQTQIDIDRTNSPTEVDEMEIARLEREKEEKELKDLEHLLPGDQSYVNLYSGMYSAVMEDAHNHDGSNSQEKDKPPSIESTPPTAPGITADFPDEEISLYEFNDDSDVFYFGPAQGNDEQTADANQEVSAVEMDFKQFEKKQQSKLEQNAPTEQTHTLTAQQLAAQILGELQLDEPDSNDNEPDSFQDASNKNTDLCGSAILEVETNRLENLQEELRQDKERKRLEQEKAAQRQHQLLMEQERKQRLVEEERIVRERAELHRIEKEREAKRILEENRRQELIRQEQERIRREEYEEKVRLQQEQQRAEELRQEQLRIEKERVRQEQLRIEQQRQEQLRKEQQRQEQLLIEQQRQEQLRIEQQRQEQLRIEQQRQEQLRIEQQRQEEERIQQEKIRRLKEKQLLEERAQAEIAQRMQQERESRMLEQKALQEKEREARLRRRDDELRRKEEELARKEKELLQREETVRRLSVTPAMALCHKCGCPKQPNGGCFKCDKPEPQSGLDKAKMILRQALEFVIKDFNELFKNITNSDSTPGSRLKFCKEISKNEKILEKFYQSLPSFTTSMKPPNLNGLANQKLLMVLAISAYKCQTQREYLTFLHSECEKWKSREQLVGLGQLLQEFKRK